MPKKNIMEVPLVGSTIPHEIEMNYGAAKVLMKPASPGTGVVAGGAVRPILELAGFRDVLAKSLGSRNAINTARATIACLKAMKVADNVANMRGRSLNDMVPWLVRKRMEEDSYASVTAVSETVENQAEINEVENAEAVAEE